MIDLLRTDFDEFLFSSIGEDANGSTLTLLSALARLDVDAWDEAARLAALPVEKATQQLATLLATLPRAVPPGAEPTTIAERLIALLHRPARKTARASTTASGHPSPPRLAGKGFHRAYYYLAALLFLLFCQWAWGAVVR